MTTLGHISALQRRHADLERQIEQELQHSACDELLVTALKRRKLEVKDELVRLERQQAA